LFAINIAFGGQLSYIVCSSRTANKIYKGWILMLKPQDVVVCLKVQASKGRDWTYRSLGKELAMSHSEVHEALKRAADAGIYSKKSRAVLWEEFLRMLKGLRYIFYVKPGRLVRGIPTAHSGPPLSDEIQSGTEDVYVWADPEGEVRGQEIEPLYPSVPRAVKNDQKLYEWLNLVEAIRVGRPREQMLAMEICKNRFNKSEKEEGN
jgi:hypothetical protein